MRRALRALWTRHAPHIDMVVRRLVGGDPDLAADIAQEVWIQIFRALPSYRGDSQFSTWAHRIAVNRTLNALRKTRRLANIETEVQEDSASVEPDPDRTFVAQSIEEAAAKLSPGARAVFMLHDVEGYTHEEIAAELGITTGGSKSQLFKARAKLRKLLAHLVDVEGMGMMSDYRARNRSCRTCLLNDSRRWSTKRRRRRSWRTSRAARSARASAPRIASSSSSPRPARRSIGAPLTTWESLRPVLVADGVIDRGRGFALPRRTLFGVHGCRPPRPCCSWRAE